MEETPVAQRHQIISTVVALAATLAAVAIPAGAAAPSAPPGTPRLVGQRAIEIPGARIISMSPDGHWLAAVRPVSGFERGSLCAIDIETLADRACADLSVLGAGLRIEDVTWSPDSAHLAFAERGFVTFVDGDLWLMDAATGALTNLDDDGFDGGLPLFKGVWPAGPITLPVNPAFSPDGSTIAFSRSILTPDARSNVIATVPVSGGPVTDLVTVSRDQMGIAYNGIAWAPDATRIYYTAISVRAADLSNGVWVVGADGNDPHLLVGHYQDTSGPAVLDVSSDGATLLLQDPAAMGSFGSGLPVYATADTTHGIPTPILTLAPGALPGATVGWAGFSPDGRWLLTVDRLLDPENQVRLRALGATEDVALLPDGLAAAGPVAQGIAMTWAANGTVLLTGAGRVETATLLTIEGGSAP